MVFCAQMSLQAYALLLFSISTEYGTAAPLVFFGVQMAILPLVWHVVHVQLHAGRSKSSARATAGERGGTAQEAQLEEEDEAHVADGGEGGTPVEGRRNSLFDKRVLRR